MGALQDADESCARSLRPRPQASSWLRRVARAQALAVLGDIDESPDGIRPATSSARPGQALELAFEIGQTEALFGEGPRARHRIEEATRWIPADTDQTEQAIYARALVRVADGDLQLAEDDVARLRFSEPQTALAFEARRYLLRGLVGLLRGAGTAANDVQVGAELAASQGGWLWARYPDTAWALSPARRSITGRDLIAADHPAILGMAGRRLWRGSAP